MNARSNLRVALAMDLSAVGRCALSVAVPVLASMGIEACPLPTMLLSTHTGFGAVEKLDTADWLENAVAHLNDCGIRFDALSFGYLGSNREIDALLALADGNPNAFILVDPAMADKGKLYSGIEPNRPDALKPLIARADLLIPNPTEARLLTGLPDSAALEELLFGLLELGCKAALITGFGNANAYIDAKGEALVVQFERVPQNYPGTGDLFAAALLGALLLGTPMEAAIHKAAEFVAASARKSYDAGTDPKFGVKFEGQAVIGAASAEA